ncbi:MAG TPA: radical SAM protein [Nitrospiraceae bacterium]|jgi:MoaA/NifB/PqqE/SkfB family radical SAM enzyme|nr:radical SAM protein [Nitrospiraceae bacterium]
MVRRDKLHHLPERFPVACQWEITCRCNLHCVMCYTDCFNRPDLIREELTTSDMLRIMDEMADAGTLELCLTGGEPMIRPDFFHIYDHAIHRGFLVTVFTNGTLITEAAADRFAALRPHRIEISLHGLTKDTFERITQGTGSYHRCLDGIKLLIDRQVPLTLKSTAMTLNQHEILAIKQYVASLGSVGYKLGEEMRPELDGGAGPFHYALSEGDLRILNQQDEDLWKESCQQSRTELSPCRSGMQRFHIDAYGKLQLCSGNRMLSYDLRNGSFRKGFFEVMPTFACEWKAPVASKPMRPTVSHA